MKLVFPIIIVVLLVSGCAQMKWPGKSRTATAPETTETGLETEAHETEIAPVPPAARTVTQFDTTTEEQKAAAVAGGASAAGVDLGVTIASLGAPSEPGFWLKTPLVDAPAKGRVSYAPSGKSVQVDLIPIDGPKTAGSRMSLSAMRLIGAPFTELPEVRVFRVGG